jgi:hypothetical protein
LIETFGAPVKNPFLADVLGVTLQRLTVFGFAFPTDFSFGHNLSARGAVRLT